MRGILMVLGVVVVVLVAATGGWLKANAWAVVATRADKTRERTIFMACCRVEPSWINRSIYM
jgi:hypothetical protein